MLKHDNNEQNGRKRISDNSGQHGYKMGMPVWGGFLFGIPFVAAGAFIMMIGTGNFEVEPSSVHAPYWVLTVAGLVFFLAGIMVWGMAVRQFMGERRQARMRYSFGVSPAMADYPWNSMGYTPKRWAAVIQGIAGAAFLTLFMSMFNYWAFGMDGPMMVKIIVTIFDIVIVFAWYYAAVQVGKIFKFSSSRITFDSFPYRLNRPVTIRWIPPAGIGAIESGSFTLRCVEEYYETSGTGDDRSRSLVHDQLWADSYSVDNADRFMPGQEVLIRFELPDGVPGTSLSADVPVYWELEVKLRLPGLDFDERYLVPVYAEG